MTQSPFRERTGKIVVAVGFGLLLAGIIAAHRTPAAGYEISVYSGTPAAFWIGFGAAVLISVAVALGTVGWTRRAALVLGTTAVLSLVALPIIRGYFFYADPDSLTHLGWSRELAAGAISPYDLFYPGIHLDTVFVHFAAGIPLEHAAMVTVLVFGVIFVVFTAATIRLIAPTDLAIVIATVSALMFLPINNITTYIMVPFPISQATLFSAFLFYLLFRYVGSARSEVRLGPLSAIGVAFGITLVSLVIYHPQQAVVMIILFGAIAVGQMIHRQSDPRSFAAQHRPVYLQTGLLLLAFLLWTPRFGGFYSQLELVFGAVQGFFLEGGGDPTVVQQQQESLVGIGVGLEEVFVKLFIVGAIYAGFAGILMIGSLGGRLDERTDLGDAASRYMAYGMAALLPFAALHLVGDLSKLFFRYFGTMMVIATIIGALALYRLGRGRYAASSTRTLLGVALVVMLALSLVALFPSPYTHQPSPHVSQAQYDGYETAFAYEDEDIETAGVRWDVWRYRHAIHGVSGQDWSGEDINASELRTDVNGAMDGEGYVIVTEFDQQREVIVYRGLRYTPEDFAGVNTQRDVHQVQSNGEVTLYYTA